MRKPAKPKAVNFVLIPNDDRKTSPYRILEEVREKWHNETREAKIALAWRKRLKRDKDGHLMLGKCIKVGDLQKEFAAFDFIILLNQEVWHDPDFTREKKLALVDHEMCHAEVMLNKDFEKVRDERDRIVYRIRKHDIEEFRAVVGRHGCYKKDLEEFAKVLLKKKQTPTLFTEPPKEKRDGKSAGAN